MSAAASLGSLAGAWGFPLHGAEVDAINLKGRGFIKALGSAGMFCSFMFLILYFGLFVRITSAPVKPKEKVKSSNDINSDKLSKETKKFWGIMKILIWFSMIFGFGTLYISSMVNEGFISSNDKTMYATLILGLGGTALTLAFIIGMLIVEWPKTKKSKTGKHASREAEDNKLYAIVAPNPVFGILLSILYLFPIISILGTELDENAAEKARSVSAADISEV